MKVIQRLISLFFFFGLGGLSTLGFAPDFLTLLSILIWVLFLKKLQDSQFNFWKAYAFGAGYFVFGLSWISNALMIDANASNLFGWMVPFFYVGTGLGLGLFFAIPARLAKLQSQKETQLWMFSVYFIFFEWVRGWFLTGLPWNRLGMIWVNHLVVAQSASVFGVLGLSAATLFLMVGIIQFLNKKQTAIWIVGCLWIFIIGYGVNRLQNEIKNTEVRLKLVQSGLSQSTKWSYEALEKNFQLHLTLSKTGSPADIILWPESAVAFDLSQDAMHREQIEDLLNEDQILLSGFIDRRKGVYNALGVFSKKGLEKTYYKHHLVPFGEYIPLKDILPLETLAQGVGGIQAGLGPKTLSLTPYPSVAPAICYENIFSKEVVEKNNRSDWILVITNDAWYGNSRGPYQHLAEAQMRAIEEGLPIIRVAYNGISAVIDPLGRIILSAPLQTQAVLDTVLPKPLPPTIFSLL